MSSHQFPIGVFDSGIGGLSVLKAAQALMPVEDFIYIADQANVPYGRKSRSEIYKFSKAITEYFVERKVKAIVVACNTASAAALYELRQAYPTMPFVGMEPAVKPAAEKTETGVVGVLATKATFQGDLYASVVERFAKGVVVLQDPCEGLVEEIEAGHYFGGKTEEILRKALEPMLAEGIDTVVLGCTHFPFVFPQIEAIVGDSVKLINPAPAVARQLQKVINNNLNIHNKGITRFYTTGNIQKFQKSLISLGIEGLIEQLSWGIDLFTD